MIVATTYRNRAGQGAPRGKGLRREAFSLLEVLLASAIAVVLMAALYVALDVQLRQAAEGRDAVEQATLVRAIVHRFDSDLGTCVSPVAPAVENGGSSTSSTGTSTTDVAAAAELSNSVALQAGVIGDSQSLTIFSTRLPDGTGLSGGMGVGEDQASPGDVRRITYWLASSGNGGLARQESPWITSENNLQSTEPDYANEANSIFAEEVTQVQFRYWNGTGWDDSWDGSELGDDGTTPIGPPLAIEVRVWIQEKEYRHVIAVASAPGTATPDTEVAP